MQRCPLLLASLLLGRLSKVQVYTLTTGIQSGSLCRTMHIEEVPPTPHKPERQGLRLPAFTSVSGGTSGYAIIPDSIQKKTRMHEMAV